MIRDILDSFKDNVKERTTNPFLGTLIIVWVLKNWVLIYSLFYFDGKLNLKSRLDYITEYFNKQSFYWNLLEVIAITLLTLIITYFLLSISRILVNFYDKVVTPWIYFITDKSSIVKKEDYVKLLDEIKLLETRLEEERLAKIRAQEERDKADQKILSLSQNIVANQTEQGATSNGEFEEEDQSIDYELLINQFTPDEVDGVILSIQQSNHVLADNKVVKRLLKFGIIKVTTKFTQDRSYYELTKEGLKFLRWWNKYSINKSG